LSRQPIGWVLGQVPNVVWAFALRGFGRLQALLKQIARSTRTGCEVPALGILGTFDTSPKPEVNHHVLAVLSTLRVHSVPTDGARR
jgi:hypothetical protein